MATCQDPFLMRLKWNGTRMIKREMKVMRINNNHSKGINTCLLVTYIGIKHRKKQSWRESGDGNKYLYVFVCYNNDNGK